jgi:putative peptidoglycan lipid II flippase
LPGDLNIKKAIFGVSGIVLISKILGFIREMVVAGFFGTSLDYDIFLVAIAGPVFFNLVIVHATNYLIVPFLSTRATTSEREEWYDIWSVFNSLLSAVVIVVVLIVAAAPLVVRIIAPDLAGEALKRGVFYCRGASVLIFLGFLESFLRSALNVKKRFVYPALGTIILNSIVIIIVYLFSGALSVFSILLGLIAGTTAQVTFLLIRFWNIKILRSFNFRLVTGEVKRLLSAGAAVVLVELMTSTYFLIDRYFASTMTEGVVSALNYCSLLVMLPVSIVGFAIASVTFPFLSERAGEDKRHDFASLLHSALSLSMVIALPCGIFYMVFAREITAGVFLRGAFDLNSLEITSRILVPLGPYLVCLFLYYILIQACYSSGRQKAVLYTAIFSVILKFILTALFRNFFGYPGIGAATSAVQIFTIGAMAVILAGDDRIRHINLLAVKAVKVLAAALPIVVIAYFYRDLSDFEVGMSTLSRIRVVWAALLSFLFFAGAGYILKISEVRSLLAAFGKTGREAGE